MLLISLAFLAGVLVLQWCPWLPPVWTYPVMVLVVPLLRVKVTRLPAVLIIAFLWAALRAEFALYPQLPAEIEGKTVILEGKVLEMPRQMSARQLRFLFAAERLDSGNGWVDFPAKVRLDEYATGLDPVAGERWQFAVRLKRPHGFSNSGGFDYERWLFQQRIRATGYIRKDPLSNRRLSVGSILPIAHLRNQLMSAFDLMQREAGKNSASLSMIRALTIGDRSSLSAGQWEVLRATGTSHLMAISGLHISLVAGLVFWLAYRLWLRCGTVTERIPAKKAAAVAGLLIAFLYALLSGFGIPVRRAFVMISVLTLALISDRCASFQQALGLAVLATLLIDPLSVLAAGWWLSFWAVMMIAYMVSGRYGQQSIPQRWMNLHVVLAFSMLPLLLIFFQQASLIAPFANIVAVPWISFLVVPVALIGTLVFSLNESAGEWLLEFAGLLLDLIWPLLEWLSGLQFSQWHQHEPLAWTLIPALFGVFVLFMPLGLPARWVGVLLLLPLFLVKPAAPVQGEALVTLLDVGQGLSTVVQTRQHVLVYDAGPRFSDSFDTGQAVVVPYLRHQGIQRLDVLVVSHGDNDHIGGVNSLLSAYPATRILSSVPDEIPAAHAGACRRGQQWNWDGVHFEILSPAENSSLTGNNASCVLRIESAGGQSALLTGDIERQAEQQLLESVAARLTVDVLVVPHHGSKTSSGPAFVKAVNPALALMPSGYRNRYGFPKAEILDRYTGIQASVAQTGLGGALSVVLAKDTDVLEIQRYRDSRPRYWQSQHNRKTAVWLPR
jgi:competence protein ComEC